MQALKDLAAKLNGVQYAVNPIPSKFVHQAKEQGIIIVHGASDDLIELCGAYNGEGDCYDGGICYFNRRGTCSVVNADFSIQAIWNNKKDPVWTYQVSYPYERFMMWESDIPYCEGIVFYHKDAVASEHIVKI